MTLDAQIEGVLFFKASPMKKTALCKLFDIDTETLEKSLQTLKNRLTGGGVSLVATDDTVELVTSAELDTLIENLRKDEMKRDIGKAGAETLAIVLYRGPIARIEIDRVRGVNSSYILRNLQVRGLVEKVTVGKQNQFQVTTDLLKHLGITEKTQLSDYADVMNALEHYETQQELETI